MLFCPECKSLVLAPPHSSEYPNSSVEWFHSHRCAYCGHEFITVERYEHEEDFHKVFDLNLK